MFSSAGQTWEVVFQKSQATKEAKAKARHPVKVHLWAGISQRGVTPAVIFTGTLTSIWYCHNIFEKGLLPFLKEVFPDHHRFQQDNTLCTVYQQVLCREGCELVENPNRKSRFESNRKHVGILGILFTAPVRIP